MQNNPPGWKNLRDTILHLISINIPKVHPVQISNCPDCCITTAIMYKHTRNAQKRLEKGLLNSKQSKQIFPQYAVFPRYQMMQTLL